MIKKLVKSLIVKFRPRQKAPPERPDTMQTSRIGNDVILDNCLLDDFTSVGDHSYLFNTEIGTFTYLASDVTIMNTKIGKFCSIAKGSKISTGRHPSHTFVSTHPAFFSLHKQCGTTFVSESHFPEMGQTCIGNDVWIGTNAIIMDDITIGDGAIVGAGSVVTKNIPPYSIVVGSPAKIIKYRFTEREIQFLLNFKWWDKEVSWLKENHLLFSDIKEFMKMHQKQQW